MHLDQIKTILLVYVNCFGNLEWVHINHLYNKRLPQSIFVLRNNCPIKAFHSFCIDDVLERLEIKEGLEYFER